MKFSIVTACLNAGEDLNYTLTNLLSQQYDDFEIIVKDGWSSDGSIERLPDDQRIVLIRKKDQNVYDAMNQALDYVTGDYCIFINAGDRLHSPTVLSELRECIEKTDGDFLYGRSFTVAEDVMRFGPPKMTKFFCFRSTICHQAMVIRSSYLKKRGYDSQLRISADREWMVYAFMEAKMKFVRTDCIITDYKGGGISAASNAPDIVRKENRIIRERFFSKVDCLKYNLILLLTLQDLRIWINRNPTLQTWYGKLKYLLLWRKP